MGIYLNPGNEMFAEAVRSAIYVDKSSLLKYTNSLLNTKEAWIPNREILDEYTTSIKIMNWSGVAEALRDSDALLKATLNKDSALVEEMMEQIHQSETSIMAYNDENALSSVITIAYYTARREYDLARELPSGKGFADISFLPKKGSSLPAMVVELKVDTEANAAIDQIKRKDYVEGLKGYSGKVLLVGISYDRRTKRHACIIEETDTNPPVFSSQT